MVKEQFRETELGRKVVGVRFSTGSSELMRQVAHIPVLSNKLYTESSGGGPRKAAPYGPLDTRLGTSQNSIKCATCNQNLNDCVGHYGYIDLELPVFHVGFFRLTIQMLQCICKRCSALLLTDDARQTFLKQISNPSLDYLRRKQLHKKIWEKARKLKKCAHCGAHNGVVKKAVGSVLKIVHAYKEDDTVSYSTAIDENKELGTAIGKADVELLTPTDVYALLENVQKADIPLLMVRSDNKLQNPINVLLTRIVVPPVCIRPSVVSDLKSGTTEDDITMKLSEIVLVNEAIRKHNREGQPMRMLVDQWDMLQILCALYINSEISGLPPTIQQKKFCRSFTQRLKGKQGRFRGNLSGKRVDFSGRTVISPDPNLRIDQVGVPIHVAKILTFPERVTAANIGRLRTLVRNGDEIYPGANYIIDSRSGFKRSLRYGNREIAAKSLKLGDIVERHMCDNDVVLFNRQPSLHKISIMSHRAKVVPGRTFRFNECVCTPYNADFDGDEMNLHFPQTEEAKAEASLLMSVKSNLITPRSGEPLIAAIQDFITGAYLLTHKDCFFPKSEVHRIAASIIDVNAKNHARIRLPLPAILKPAQLWTGKQLIELIICPDAQSSIRLNMTAKNKSYTGNEELCIKDSYVIIRNNVLLCGVLDKSLLGANSKTNIFYMLLRDFGEDAAVDAMWRLSRMMPTFLTNHGFSIGIGDVRPSKALLCDKRALLAEGYQKCDMYIGQLKSGELKAQPGCSAEQTLESLILKELSMIRDRAGQVCLKNLSRYNSPLTMAVCGSKGSFINISQMIACVGQQAISGHRPPDGFENRCFPHFQRNEKTPAAKGFVENSFYSGLTPTEFFFHTMGGREGLVDTAVKTAETGYMQRRLVKCLEDLCTNYDNTVRSSVGDVVEFIFGEDSLDPAMMEAKNGDVVDFDHVLDHVRHTVEPVHDETKELQTDDMRVLIESTIERLLKKYSLQFFRTKMEQFIYGYLEKTRKYWSLIDCCKKHDRSRQNIRSSCVQCKQLAAYRRVQIRAHCISQSQAVAFVEICCDKVRRAITEPGTAVGAIAATSIGEPSTQMTLKTFHFAGVASMNITQGVPRIKEIINAVKCISTPVITATLVDEKDQNLARRVKARIEKTTLGEISDYIEEVYLPDDCFVLVKINAKRVRLLQLEISMQSVCDAIRNAKLPVSIKVDQVRIVGKSTLCIRPTVSKISKLMCIQYLKYNLDRVVVKGLPNVSRCVIHADEQKGDSFKLFVEGTDFLDVMITRGIDHRHCTFNNALTVATTLGIEAARTSIIREILSTMESHGIGLDQRHVMLLADLMTYRGEVLGITRNGLVKMKESVLLLASFERTTDHLYEAAFFSQEDRICGVSESIIMGVPMAIGTGLFKLLHKVDRSDEIRQRVPIFDSNDFRLDK